MPQNVTLDFTYDDSIGGCVIKLEWSPPINLDLEDISHYIVYVNGTDVLTRIIDKDEDANLTIISYPVHSCGAHNVSVSAVNRCGHEGQRSADITLEAIILPGKYIILIMIIFFSS